jgi:hypothetical protein
LLITAAQTPLPEMPTPPAPPFSDQDLEAARLLLLELGAHVRDQVITGRKGIEMDQLSAVSRESAADTIYEIDRISEEAIGTWFERHWPAHWPLEIVMEGIDPDEPVTVPSGTPISQTILKCILDPIDGTRGIMYDKRAAWFLAAIGSQLGANTRLGDLRVAAMVELPTTRSWRSDSISAVRGQGVHCHATNLFDRTTAPVRLLPSKADHIEHGFAYISRFFPIGKALTATIEETLWRKLLGDRVESVVFEDQYISTGGQFHEIMAGRDRFIADIRPLVFAELNVQSGLCCHPYDVCSSFILEEAGVIIEKPLGGSLDALLDTTSPVSWVAYANQALADRVRPFFQTVLRDVLHV